MDIYGLEMIDGLPVMQCLGFGMLELDGRVELKSAKEIIDRGRYSVIFKIQDHKLTVLATTPIPVLG